MVIYTLPYLEPTQYEKSDPWELSHTIIGKSFHSVVAQAVDKIQGRLEETSRKHFSKS